MSAWGDRLPIKIDNVEEFEGSTLTESSSVNVEEVQSKETNAIVEEK